MYGSDYRYSAAGTGSNTARWQLTGLAAGTYDVAVDWIGVESMASNAPYQIYDGATLLGTVIINQQAAPTGTPVNGAVFQSLGVFPINSGTLKVVLSNNTNNSYVIADALRVVPVA